MEIEFYPIYLFHLIISPLLVLFESIISKHIIMEYYSSHNFIIKNVGLFKLT